MGAIDTGDLAKFVVARFKKGKCLLDEETSGLKMFSEEFMAKVGTSSTGALRIALARLVDKRLIYQYGGEYKFTNPFFREWIRRKM